MICLWNHPRSHMERAKSTAPSRRSHKTGKGLAQKEAAGLGTGGWGVDLGVQGGKNKQLHQPSHMLGESDVKVFRDSSQTGTSEETAVVPICRLSKIGLDCDQSYTQPIICDFKSRGPFPIRLSCLMSHQRVLQIRPSGLGLLNTKDPHPTPIQEADRWLKESLGLGKIMVQVLRIVRVCPKHGLPASAAVPFSDPEVTSHFIW